MTEKAPGASPDKLAELAFWEGFVHHAKRLYQAGVPVDYDEVERIIKAEDDEGAKKFLLGVIFNVPSTESNSDTLAVAMKFLQDLGYFKSNQLRDDSELY